MIAPLRVPFLLVFLTGAALAANVAVDATSGASVRSCSGTATGTGATVSWTYSKTNGTWKLFYGTTDHAAPSVSAWTTSVTTSGKAGTLTLALTGLAPNTKYYAVLAGWLGTPGSTAQSWAHMSFTTEGTAGVVVRPEEATPAAQGYDAFGRRMGRIPAAGYVRFSRDQASQVRVERRGD
jgi:hypothetical protein